MKIPFFKVLAIPILMIAAGVASNQAVLIANHGKFPVMLNERQTAHMEAGKDQMERMREIFSILNTGKTAKPIGGYDDVQFIDDVHSVMGPNSRLKAMADVFNMGDAIYSVGDGLIELGFWLFGYAPIVWCVLVVRRENERK